MVLSNAERQARYRERLKAAARGEMLPEMVAEALDAAFNVVWALHHRENYGGLEEFADAAAWKEWIADPKTWRGNGHPVQQMRAAFSYGYETETPEERDILNRAVRLLDAVTLKPVAGERG